jgi:hypothetical protein
MNDIHDLPGVDRAANLLDQGVVTATSTVVSLLGLDLLGIRQLRVVTTLETWLKCAEYAW